MTEKYDGFIKRVVSLNLHNGTCKMAQVSRAIAIRCKLRMHVLGHLRSSVKIINVPFDSEHAECEIGDDILSSVIIVEPGTFLLKDECSTS